jgi:uncharacterized phage protein (TIGR01671 family)
MREILFRGKREDDGERMCGNLTLWGDGTASIDETPAEASPMYAVDPDTVGQYTGLTDKNGKKIFEGDVIRFQKFNDEPLWIGVVVYENCLYIAKGVIPLSYEKREGEKAAKHGFEVQVSGINTSTIEIICNIHDNPELLKGGEGDGDL